MLGEAVQLRSIPDGKGDSTQVYRSGTLIATPVASAVAATIIEVVHKMKHM
jgi:hypothetical protein